MRHICKSFRPDIIMHLAIESHVDRSIDGLASSSKPTSRGPTCCFRAHATIGRALARPKRHCFASTTSRPMRSSDRLAMKGCFLKPPLSAKLALFGFKGSLRPFGASLASYLWHAGGHLELLQQLWTLPFSRKAHTAGHSERTGGQAYSCLR